MRPHQIHTSVIHAFHSRTSRLLEGLRVASASFSPESNTDTHVTLRRRPRVEANWRMMIRTAVRSESLTSKYDTSQYATRTTRHSTAAPRSEERGVPAEVIDKRASHQTGPKSRCMGEHDFYSLGRQTSTASSNLS